MKYYTLIAAPGPRLPAEWYSQFPHTMAQRPGIHSQDIRGTPLSLYLAPGGLENTADMVRFDIPERHHGQVRTQDRCGYPPSRFRNTQEAVELQRFPVRQDEGPLHGIFDLPDIPRPVIAFEAIEGFFADTPNSGIYF